MKLVVITLVLAMLSLHAIAERDPARCAELREKVKRIDSQARQRSTTSLQERRRKAMDEMYRLHCSKMDRR